MIIIASSCTTKSTTKQSKSDYYIIDGTVTGYKDSTWILLADESQHHLILSDSTLIINGRFHFAGTLPQRAVEVRLSLKTTEDFVSFWLEKSTITFEAERGNLKKAIIAGSKTQIEAERLNSITSAFRDKAWRNLSRLSKKVDPHTKKILMKENDSLLIKELFVTKKFITNNPTSIVSAYFLDFYSSEWAKSFITTSFNNFQLEIKNSSYGKDISAYLRLNKDLKIGDHYADFKQQNTSGNLVKLSDYTGKLTLLEFWASWCGPCRKDNPVLIKIYDKFKNKGFKIISVSADDKKRDWLKAIEKDKLPWPQVCGLKGDQNDVVLMYGVNKFPSNFLIDEKGIIIAQDLRGEDLNKKLSELLK